MIVNMMRVWFDGCLMIEGEMMVGLRELKLFIWELDDFGLEY